MEEDIPETSRSQSIPTHSINWFLVISTSISVLLLFIIVFLYIENKHLKQIITSQNTLLLNEETQNIAKDENSETSIIPTDIEVSPINSLNWETYEDDRIGLRFKYPSSWGVPISDEEECDKLCSEDELTSYRYWIRFPNSDFTVGGTSKNWAPARGMNILYDFQGFYDEVLYGGWNNKEKLCNIPWFLSCDIEDTKNDKVLITSSISCSGESGSGFNYERLMLINVDNKSNIDGLAFGGNFIPSDAEISNTLSCEKEEKAIIDRAILERQAEPKVLETLDTYDEVFDTVEIY